MNKLNNDINDAEEIKTPTDSTDAQVASKNDTEESGDRKESVGGKARAFFRGALEYIKFAKLELIIIFASVFLDLLTKLLIDRSMREGQVNVLIPDFLQFHYSHNDKAAFGSAFGLERVLSDGGVMTFFIIFSLVVVSVFCYLLYHFKNEGWLVRISLALIIGGAFGNLYDRMVFGYVRDFIEFVFFGFDVPVLGRTFAIFNLADASLVIGMILLMWFLLFKYKPDNIKQSNDENSK